MWSPRCGKFVGSIVATLYQAGRDTIDMVLKNVLPFMAFVSFLIGLITSTGVGDWIAGGLTALASSIIGLVMLVVHLLDPDPFSAAGPGRGDRLDHRRPDRRPRSGPERFPPQYALPALFAIDSQVGCDFIPVGLALAEAEPETTEMGVPAVLVSRMITGPVSVILAYFASFGMYTS